MQLLHPEIEIMPGRSPQRPPGEGQIGPGSALVRLVNNTTKENAYIVRLHCDNPYWQDKWYALTAVPRLETGENNLLPEEAEQYGPGQRWIKIYVPRGETRDIIISFQLRYTPDSRAGVYPFKVVVETFVSGAVEETGRRNRFTELNAVAIVRPFYKWNIDIIPEEGLQVGRIFRRTGNFEVVITNQGNDWLYCDLQLPHQKDVLTAMPTLRVAVPPPEVDEAAIQRAIPLYATTRLKHWRGDPVSQSLPLSAVRVDAPSIAPRPVGELNGNAAYSRTTYSGAPLVWTEMNGTDLNSQAHFCNVAGGAVVATETSDMAQAPTDRSLIYNPPLPASLMGFFGTMFQGVRGLLASAIALFLVFNLGIFMFEVFYHSSIIAEPLSTNVDPGGALSIGGKYLIGAKVYINGSDEAAPQKAKNKNIYNPIAVDVLQTVAPYERQFVTILVDPKYNGQKIKLSVQRAGILSFLSPLLPKYKCLTEVQVGTPPVLAVTRVAATGGQYSPGGQFTIKFSDGPPLKGKPLSVGLGGIQATLKSWAADKIIAVVPKDAPPGTMQVTVKPSDGGIVHVNGSIEIIGPLQPAAAAGSAGVGKSASGGAGGASSGSAGGAKQPALPPPASLQIKRELPPMGIAHNSSGGSPQSNSAAATPDAASLEDQPTETPTPRLEPIPFPHRKVVPSPGSPALAWPLTTPRPGVAAPAPGVPAVGMSPNSKLPSSPLAALPPAPQTPATFMVGTKAQLPMYVTRQASVAGDYYRGGHFTLHFWGGPRMRQAPKFVGVGGAMANVESWAPDKVVAIVPAKAPSGPVLVTVEPEDGGTIIVTGIFNVLDGSSADGSSKRYSNHSSTKSGESSKAKGEF